MFGVSVFGKMTEPYRLDPDRERLTRRRRAGFRLELDDRLPLDDRFLWYFLPPYELMPILWNSDAFFKTGYSLYLLLPDAFVSSARI